MINISLGYGMILKLEIYMENEIKSIAEKYRKLSWEYQETCLYNADKRSCHTNYNIDKEYYDSYTKSLQIRQYETFKELKKLTRECKEQNSGHNYICYTNGLIKELIRFNPSYDNLEESLERLKSA